MTAINRISCLGGCRCGPPPNCTIFADALNDEEINTEQWDGEENFTENDQYASTSTSDVYLTCLIEHPDAIPSHYVEVEIYGAANDSLRLRAGDHYAQLTFGSSTESGCLSLYEAGIFGDTLLNKVRVDAAVNTFAPLKVWYGHTSYGLDLLIAKWGDTYLRAAVTRDGNAVYLGTGTISSTVRFRNFVYQKHRDDDNPTCPEVADVCLFYEEDFEREDLGCNWSGDGEIVSGELELSSGETATCETTNGEDGSLKVVATCTGSDSGSEAIVYADTVAGNYGKLTVGTGATLKLYAGNVEVDSVDVTAVEDIPHEVTVTAWRGFLSAQFGSFCASATAINSTTPTTAGLGASGAGSVTFDDFSLSYSQSNTHPDCPTGCVHVECSGCIDDEIPDAFQVPLSGIINAEGCDEWTDLNAVHEVLINPGTGSCTWSLSIPICTTDSDLGNDEVIILQIAYDIVIPFPVGDPYWEWRMTILGDNPDTNFVVYVSDPHDVDDYPTDCTGEVVLTKQSQGGLSPQLDDLPETITITPLFF